MARAHHGFRDGKPIDEAGAGGGDVKGKAGASANLGLNARCGRRKSGIRRGRGNDNAINRLSRNPRIGECRLGSGSGQV